MPQKPFNFMIVSLNKDYHPLKFKRGDVCVVTPHNWYGNTNGWSKDDPEKKILEQEELQLYKSNPGLYANDLIFWKQERGYELHSDDSIIVVPFDDNFWNVLNIDGQDRHNMPSLPEMAMEVLKEYQ